MPQPVISQPVPEKGTSNSIDAQSNTTNGGSTNRELDGRSSTDKHGQQSRVRKDGKGDKKRKRPSNKNDRNVKSKADSSSPLQEETSLRQILGPSLNELLESTVSPPASNVSTNDGTSSSMALVARANRKPVRLTAVKQQLQQQIEENERLKNIIKLLEKEIDKKNKEIERKNKSESSHKIEIKNLTQANDKLMRQLSNCKDNNVSKKNDDNEKCELTDLKKHVVSVARSLLAAVNVEDNDGDFIPVSRRQRSRPSVSPLPVVIDRVGSSPPNRPPPPQDVAKSPSATAATQGPSCAAATTPANPSHTVKSRVPGACDKPLMAVIGTSLVRGLGHQLTKQGFEVSTFMYPGAELPLIRDRIPAILSNKFQPAVVMLQCAGNDIGNGRPTAQVVEQFDCLIQDIKRCCPGADIVVNKIPPRGHNDNLLGEIEMVNTYITNVSKQRGLSVYCSDSCPKMYRYFKKDAVHFNHAGKRLYAHEMAKVLINFPRRSLHHNR